MESLILIIIALMFTIIGFEKFVYFLSIGYAFAVVGLTIGIGFIYSKNINLLMGVMLSVICFYALRLGIFLINREASSKAYKRVLKKSGGEKKMPFFVQVFIWIVCSLMYYAQVSPMLFRISNGRINEDRNLLIAGIVVSALGFIIQSISDIEKSKAKSINPSSFCDRGLFRIVRCPNYFGELLVWTGVLISGITVLNFWWQYTISLIGYILIFYVMLSSTKRLEESQDKKYGGDLEYQRYKRQTPILVPLIPLKTLKNAKWLVI